MTDLTQTIMPKTDQLNADSLIAGPITITIRKVSADPSAPEQPVSIFYEGDEGKPYKPCKSMRRVLVATWGPDGQAYVGRSMTLYRDPEVQFGGIKVGGLRISHMSHIERDLTMALTASKAQRKPYTVRKMEAPKPASEPKGQEVDFDTFKARALQAAEQGSVTFRGFWNHEDIKPLRAALSQESREEIVGKCQEIAREADAKGAPDQSEPFTPDDPPREREPGEEG